MTQTYIPEIGYFSLNFDVFKNLNWTDKMIHSSSKRSSNFRFRYSFSFYARFFFFVYNFEILQFEQTAVGIAKRREKKRMKSLAFDSEQRNICFTSSNNSFFVSVAFVVLCFLCIFKCILCLCAPAFFFILCLPSHLFTTLFFASIKRHNAMWNIDSDIIMAKFTKLPITYFENRLKLLETKQQKKTKKQMQKIKTNTEKNREK